MALVSFQPRHRAAALLLTAAAAALGFCGPQALQGAPAPPGYSVVDLGPMDDGILNDAGEVAGNRPTNRPFPALRPAYFWRAGARVPRKLPHQLTHGLGRVANMSRTLPTRILLDTSFRSDGPYYLWDGRNHVEAVTPWRMPTTIFDMNSAGDVVGALKNGSGGQYYYPFIKKHGQTAQLIPSSDSDHVAIADEINDFGVVSGSEYDRDGIGRGVFWDAQGVRHDLGDPPGVAGVVDMSIRVVGARQPPELEGAVYWKAPDSDEVHTIPYYWTEAGGFQFPHPPLPSGFDLDYLSVDMSAQGLVVITAIATTDQRRASRAFTWNPATDVYTDLSPKDAGRTQVAAINSLGEIVLEVQNVEEPVHYLVWKNGSAVDLGRLAPLNATYSHVASINDRSQIFAFARTRDITHAYLFTPRAKL